MDDTGDSHCDLTRYHNGLAILRHQVLCWVAMLVTTHCFSMILGCNILEEESIRVLSRA